MLSAEKKHARKRLDDVLNALVPAKRTPPPKSGWIKAIRTALGMTGQQFANRLGVAWQSMDDLEKSEARGAITLASLRKAASELDCTLAYALVPNTSLESTVNNRARMIALRALTRAEQTMALENQEVDPADREQRITDYITAYVRDGDLWKDN